MAQQPGNGIGKKEELLIFSNVFANGLAVNVAVKLN